MLARRAENIFGDFFEGEESILNLVQKGSLFKKQISENWTTLCLLATQSVGETPKIYEILDIILVEVWKSAESTNNYTALELIYVILLRNIHNETLREISKKFLSIPPETLTQKMVHEILSKLDK